MVHLHSMSLRGFKTFAKPTELTFEPGVTVIIGPNGSGKSNIADAVLWVLGEQSPANLRGRNMQDVIFSGPGGRRSSAVAEVSLVFDNGSGALPVDCEQLEVTRRLTRDSGSEYRLNGSGCRLLDVQDLMSGLGLGREMHSVISQGKVESLLNSTPEARRALVEEAAGLGRFKKRRERAQVKLERSRQNLLRVADIEREVKAALRPLRQQVAAAEKFAEATEEWALARAGAALYSLVEVQESSRALTGELGAAEARVEEIGSGLARLRKERAAEEERFAAALEAREKLSSVFHRVRAQAEYIDGRAASLRQRLARAEGELDRAGRRRNLAESEAAVLAARLAEVVGGIADEARLARVAGWLEALRTALEAALPDYRAALAAEDDLKDRVFELEASRSRALQHRDFLRREVDDRGRVGSELVGLAEAADGRVRTLEAEGTALAGQMTESRLLLERAEAELRTAAVDREEARADADEAARDEAAIGEQLAGLEARQAVLTDMLARREGAPAGARELLARGQGWRSLTEVVAVEPGYERAVAAALGPLIQAVLVPEGSDLDEALTVGGPLEALGTAREASGAESQTSAASEPPEGTVDIWRLVSCSDAVMDVLRRLVPPTAVLVGKETLEDASRLGRNGWRLATLSGELLQPGLHIARRQEVGAETLLRGRSELQAAASQQQGLLEKRDTARAAAARAAAAVSEAEDRCRRREEQLREAERRLTARTGDCDLHARRLEEARLQRGELQGRTARESGLAEQLVADLGTVEDGMKERERELEQARAELRALQARLDAMRKRVAELEEKKGQAALVEVRLRERCRSHENERSRALSQQEAADREMTRCERRVEAFARYVPVLARLLSLAEQLAENSRTAVADLEGVVEATRARTDEVAGVMRDWGGTEAEFQRELQELTARSTDLRVAQARLDDRTLLLEEELAELRRRHMSPRSLTTSELSGENTDSLAAAVERAERRRERIGPVNPLAEQECAEMEERARFLSDQRRDLEASLAQLGDVIAELDEHIERSFSEIFEAAKEHFSAVIASVFPGAKGTLRLTEPKPPLGSERGSAGRATAARPGDTVRELRAVPEGAGAEEDEAEPSEQNRGIAIEVRFANKSPRSLSLLSGGEKAMTAIAFLFSLFLARPCPFYILDEVEASLDDINIRRFLGLIRKYRDRTQFIVITHQRQTMEVADTLYGITLESDGTSRVLSRRLAAAKGA